MIALQHGQLPYVEFQGRTPDGLSVWLVDGDDVRDLIDPDFTDYGEHAHDAYVPEAEIWIDAETKPSEVEFFVTSAERERRLSESDHTYDLVHDQVDAASRGERQLDDDALDDVQTSQLASEGPVEVWVVDGEAVRRRFDPDFIYGGHWLVYPFIPRCTIWLEDTLSDTERPAILLHELSECVDMAQGMAYKPAHRRATALELDARRDPARVWELIRQQADRASQVVKGDGLSAADQQIITTLKAAGLYDGLAALAKSQPSAGAVHVTTALGNEDDKPKKAKTFSAIVGTSRPAGAVDFTSTLAKRAADAPEQTGACTCSGAEGDVDPACPHHGEDVEKRTTPRHLKPMDDERSHTPFSHDAAALNHLRSDQVPRFLGAITDADKLERRSVRLQSLHSLQDRVDTAKVEAMQDTLQQGGDLGDKPPVVTRFNGKNYIADGHHRLAAQWLNGEHQAEVGYKDLTAHDQALKRASGEPGDAMANEALRTGAGGGQSAPRNGAGKPTTLLLKLAEDDGASWSLPFRIEKAEPDRQLIFGWASVSERNGQLIIDKQGDIILPDDLELAAYDYVLTSREHDDMHTSQVSGRLVESMVFTKEKQKRLGIHGLLKDAQGRVLDTAWWCGWRIDSPELWAAHKRGERPELSIGGRGERVSV